MAWELASCIQRDGRGLVPTLDLLIGKLNSIQIASLNEASFLTINLIVRKSIYKLATTTMHRCVETRPATVPVSRTSTTAVLTSLIHIRS